VTPIDLSYLLASGFIPKGEAKKTGLADNGARKSKRKHLKLMQAEFFKDYIKGFDLSHL
jgi:hypothetical protein